MRDDRSSDGIEAIVHKFEELVANFEKMIALNKADGGDPEVIARLENAKASASQGATLARQARQLPSE